MGGNNKIKLVIKKWKKKKEGVIVSPLPIAVNVRKKTKKKCPSFFHFSWPNVLRKKGNKLCSLVLLGRIERRKEGVKQSVILGRY